MKKLSLLFCAALLLGVSGLAGQTGIISSGSDMITFMNSDLDYIENQKERYSRIEGSAYLDEAFHSGSVSYKRKKYLGLQLRHNPFEGYFEFQSDAGIKIIPYQKTKQDGTDLNRGTPPTCVGMDTATHEMDLQFYAAPESHFSSRAISMPMRQASSVNVWPCAKCSISSDTS